MEGYGYPYGPGYQGMVPPEPQYLDHGDGYAEYYSMSPMAESTAARPSRSKQRVYKRRSQSRSLTHSKSGSRSRSRSRSVTQSRTRTRSRSRSRSRSGSRSKSRSRTTKEINIKEPSFMDAFRVLYLTPSKHRKNTSKFLATKKRQDKVQEFLKSDGLGSKRWMFYPRSYKSEVAMAAEAGRSVESRQSCDQRVKVDSDFFHKYKRSKKVDEDAPIRKLKRWELVFYKKLGFIQAV